jgi:initiation factor 1A
MVKNDKGGNKSKKIGRKFITAPVDKKVRMAQEEGEIYAVVTKMLGNGMFYVNDPEGKERLVVMRNKFRGRNKNENTVALGTWVLVGEREFESSSRKPKCDLLEVYNDGEKQKLKRTGNPIFDKLKSEHDTPHDDNGAVVFENTDTNKYKELMETIATCDVTNKVNTIEIDSGDLVDIDDI